VLEDDARLTRLRRRVLRHWHWGRTQGFGRLIEEDQLDPFTRASTAWNKRRWRAAHGVAPGAAVPVYLVGVQRSGTNMLVRGLETSPEFEVHNENDSRAFHRFRLRPDAEIAALVSASRHRYVLFKPLCDSHRTDELLDTMGTPAPGRAIWAYREVDGRVRSALAKFGDVNLQVLAEIARGEGQRRWQAQRLSPESLELIRSFDYERLDPASAAALFWRVRNGLFFETGLQAREDVMLSSYDALVANPEPGMRALCRFLDFPYSPRLVSHVDQRSTGPGRELLVLHPRVRAACDELQERLDAAAAAQLVRLTSRTNPAGTGASEGHRQSH
jgi:hypothetical protein